MLALRSKWLYEGGMSALSILAEHDMTRHGHRRLACLVQVIEGPMLSVDAQYECALPRG